MKIQKRIAALLLAALTLVGCTGCAGVSSSTNQNDMEFVSTGGKDIERAVQADDVFSLNSNPNYSFNPLIATNLSNQLICDLVYENMVEVDDNFEVIPNVITTWTHSDDCKTWTLNIGEGPVFHDGTPVTAKDLRYSLDRAITADRYLGRFASYQGAYVANDTQLVVSLGLGDGQFIKLLNIPIIKSGSYGEKYPIGSGPYTYNEDHTELHAYEGYSTEYASYGSLPVDVIYIKEYPAQEEIISAFEDAYIDVTVNDPSSYTNLGFASANEIRSFATTNMHYVAFNEKTLLGRYNVFRYALSYAFDRAYLEELLGGNAAASPIPMYPTCPSYPQELADKLAYNMDTCKRILEGAGVLDHDNDGRLEYMSGSIQEIELSFLVCSDSSAKAGVANRFAEIMDSIGLTVVVNSLPWDDYVEALQKGEFDMYYGEIKLRNNFDLTELLDPDNKYDEEKNPNGINFTGITDPNYVMYLNDYLAAGDVERDYKYNQFCSYLTENCPIVVIGFEKQEIITHRGCVKGVDANAGNPLYNFQNWEITLG